MKLIKHSSEKLIYKSNTFLFGLSGIAVIVGGLALMIPSLTSLGKCLKHTACYQNSIHFQSLDILHDGAGTLAGLVILILGIGLFIITSTFKVILDLAKNQLVTQQDWLFLRKSEKRQYLLSDISTIDIDISKDTGADPDTYRVVARLTSGELVPLDIAYSGDEYKHRKRIKEIKQFLSLL